MNAAVLVSGYAANGPQGARKTLAEFWGRVGVAATLSPFRRSLLDVLLGRWSLDYSPAYIAMDLAGRMFSPYDLNPAGTNPLTEILDSAVDFTQLKQAPIKLFVTATNVHTGRGRVFRNAEITSSVLLASACVPTMFQAVEIEAESYWDGGYSGNPTMTPLVRECRSQDTILVQINPIERKETPRSAREILNRLNEVAFNSVLLKELRLMALLRQVSEPASPEIAMLGAMRIHRIASDTLAELGSSSKLNAEMAFLTMLHDEGRSSAEQFLVTHRADIGVRSTFDLASLLDGL
jgi:NTE family protein